MKKYVCDVCGYVYDPEKGDPDSGIAPGTAFEDIPNDWVCPECGVGKEDFSEMQLYWNELKRVRNFLDPLYYSHFYFYVRNEGAIYASYLLDEI